MGKMFGLMLMVGVVYVGATIYTEGPEHAFGGAFSFLTVGDDAPERASEYVSRPKRTAAHVEQVIEQGAARYEDLVDD